MVAVTGANGLLGSFILRRLVETGRACVGLKRTASDLSLLEDIKDKIIWRDADILDPVALEESLTGVTHLIHVAASVSFNPSLQKRILNTNVTGTTNVVNACLHNKVSRLVHISSVAALGRQKGQHIIDEKNKWIDNAANSTYAISKYQAELEVFRGEEEGLSTVILNPSVILAPADWNKSSAQLFKYVWKERPFYINSHLNFVDVRDVAEATILLLDSPIRNQRFVLNGGHMNLLEFFIAIAQRFGKKPPYVRLRKSLLQIVAFFEKIRSNFSSSEPLITSETARLVDTRFSYNSQKVENQLNLKFKTIDQSLDWCCDYYLRLHGKK